MNAERWSLAVAVPMLALFGAVSWMLLLQDPLEVDASGLGEIPLEVAQWQGAEIEMDSGVEEMLDADFHLQRAYRHPVGDLVWLYVGYYGTDRGGRSEHTPWQCYPSAGWEILERDVVDVVSQPGKAAVRANELLVGRGGERRLVRFWYQSIRRSGMVSDLDQVLDHFLARLQFGRADGSLVRLSTPIAIGEDVSVARARLRAFGREILPLLESHWPEEASRLAARR